MTQLAIVRRLTAHEANVLRWLVEHGLSADSPFRDQLSDVAVVGQCECGCGTIDLAVGGHRARPGQGLQVVVDAEGVDPNGIEVAVILFASDGQLCCLEVYGPAGADAAQLPTLASMNVI